ncbi:MAG: CinA family nicotinamide mononucleotide deamidase-related protein [Tissierellia bacterium]|nr:CinA family nicotinamide mononucleotide deamidase-related protein [Tissierellia bacterium]
MKAEIYSIGSEILLGNILDTNSQYLATKLQEFGIDVHRFVTIGDNFNRLKNEFEKSIKNADYIICTGGLGPTADDITKEVAMKFSDEERVLDQKSYDRLKEYFGDDETALSENMKQAIFPKNSIILDNEIGTAPGVIINTTENSKIILMPGVPHEMKEMFENKVKRFLKREAIIKSRILKIALLGEWDMARRVDLNSKNPTVSPYATEDGCILRITAKADDEKIAQMMIERKQEELEAIFGNLIYATDDQTRQSVLVELLKQKGEKISTAESITGGMIASSIIDIPTAREVIEESYVTYSDEVKSKLLNVNKQTLENYGAVSLECAIEMLEGLYEKTKSELCVITTGFAHTGEVFVGIKYKDRRFVKKLNLKGSRNHVRKWAVNKALDYALLMDRSN